jgi:hypothetical protein
MSLALSAQERDELYHRAVIHLTGIDDVYTAVEEEDWAKAQRLGEEFSDLLRLLCSDLGWGDEEQKDTFPLRTPPEVLRRAVENLQNMASHDRAHFEGERAKVTEELDEALHLEKVCERILADLG